MLEKLKRMQKSALCRMQLAEKSKNRELEKFRLAVEEYDTITRLIKREKGEQ